MELSNGVLIHYPTRREEPGDLVVTLPRPQLLTLLAGAGRDEIRLDGDPASIVEIVTLTDEPDPALPPSLPELLRTYSVVGQEGHSWVR